MHIFVLRIAKPKFKILKQEIKKITPMVKALLEKDVTYADDDTRLCCRILIDLLNLRGFDAHEISAYDLFMMQHKRLLPTAGAITRAKRKLEEEFVSLRGHTYDKRHKVRPKEVKQEIREIKLSFNPIDKDYWIKKKFFDIADMNKKHL